VLDRWDLAVLAPAEPGIAPHEQVNAQEKRGDHSLFKAANVVV
jgi:hypothetical protein